MKSIEHLTGMVLAVSGTETELRRELAAALTLPRASAGHGYARWERA